MSIKPRRRVNASGGAAVLAVAAAVLVIFPGCRAPEALGAAVPASAAAGRVVVEATPDGGIQPQAAVDARGTVHLIYLKGDPAAGDLFYTRRDAGKTEWAGRIRVNSQPAT